MKRVASSLVALAIAMAPMTALAKPAPSKSQSASQVQRTAAGKVKHRKGDKGKVAEKGKERTAAARVKENKKEGARVKATPHAHGVDLAGAGHREPTFDDHGVLVQASAKSTGSRGKVVPAKATELPPLPNPNEDKPSKGGAEKEARKPTAKKHASDEGEHTRDEELAELVARIRGIGKASTAGEHADEKSSRSRERVAKAGDPADDATEQASNEGRTKGRDDGVVKNASHVTQKGSPCLKDPVEIVRGPEVERVRLTKCDGSVAPLAIEQLSILVRPGSVARPTAPLAELAKKPGPNLAHGIRRVDPRLVVRLQSVAEHFGKPGAPAKLFIISGYRPASVGSMHSTGRAVDFRVEGVKNEDVVTFCKTLPDTGCGYYPNSSFVHLDVRDPGAGHVSWIDASGPGETPRYVTQWPPPPPPREAERLVDRVSVTSRSFAELAAEGERLLRARRPLDRESMPEPVDEHPAAPAP